MAMNAASMLKRVFFTMNLSDSRKMKGSDDATDRNSSEVLAAISLNSTMNANCSYVSLKFHGNSCNLHPIRSPSSSKEKCGLTVGPTNDSSSHVDKASEKMGRTPSVPLFHIYP
eukprot:GHVO01015237.1.p1 GENE.GHVO01015237.1~~GHVO01015237.1.p1  ORF type:complete len:114 (-),score=11.90 GHVO01015237.1:10-351(-)